LFNSYGCRFAIRMMLEAIFMVSDFGFAHLDKFGYSRMKMACELAQTYIFLKEKFSSLDWLFRFYVHKKRGRCFTFGSNAL
jgi:hypothetical protein